MASRNHSLQIEDLTRSKNGEQSIHAPVVIADLVKHFEEGDAQASVAWIITQPQINVTDTPIDTPVYDLHELTRRN